MAAESIEATSASSTSPESGPFPRREDGAPAKEEAVLTETIETPYTIFTHHEKRFISLVASFGAMFSTLSSYIYMPAITPMAVDLGTTVAMINLTVTSYMIVAGVAPAFMGDLADQGGRRPAYLLMFIILVGANTGLAVQNSYAALFALRMLQSAGASGTYGGAYGFIGDITTVAERGSYVGWVVVITGAAPSFGPVIAGALAQKLGWRWIFWFLVILTASYLVTIALFLPETQRKIVGNGTQSPSGIHRSLFDIRLKSRRSDEKAEPPKRASRSCYIPNPFKSIKTLFQKDNFTVILIGSLTYTVKMTLQTSLAAQCIEIYGLDYLEAGLIYLPSGVGGALASHLTGRFLDRNIRNFSTATGRERLYKRGDDISDFPIEQARLVGVYIAATISAVGTAAYGVSLLMRAHLAIPLILQFIAGASTSSIFTMCGTLLTDLNPHTSATAQSSYNLVRCLGAGIGIGIQQPLTDAAGVGWCFGVFGMMMVPILPLARILKTCRMAWRSIST